MGMAYDGPALLTTAAQVANLTGRQGLDRLAGDLTVATFLLNAHRWVFRQLERRGITPGNLTNQTRLEHAVALQAVAMLIGGNYLEQGDGADAAFYLAQAESEVEGYVPTYAETTAGGRFAGEGLPMLGSFEQGINYQLESGPGSLTYRRPNPRRQA